ncbi:MAG: TIGR04255 family protein [Acidobacteriota bacterium]|nr:TIGR04255 family protein [Acidobacteriota bacterium]
MIYGKNPLIEVLCQLRYPSILLIDSDVPAVFQDKIRTSYPLFAEGQQSELKVDLPQEVVELSKGAFPKTLRAGKASYDFVSADKKWKVGLTRDFLALSTTKYRQWEKFKEHLNLPLLTLIDVYKPPFFSRIGLRYRDVIKRSKLGLKETPWAELLKPNIVGELASEEIATCITGIAKMVQFKLPDENCEILMQHGFVQDQEAETCYIIDTDFFMDENTEVNDAITRLNTLNQISRGLFRWCITDRLHEAMEPNPL